MSNLKVTAKPDRLFPLKGVGRRLSFVGWRECLRAPDGSYKEEAEHIVPAAPGIRLDGEGQWASQTSDLYVEGFEVHLTRIDPETKKPMVVEVPDESYYRVAVRDGDLEQVK